MSVIDDKKQSIAKCVSQIDATMSDLKKQMELLQIKKDELTRKSLDIDIAEIDKEIKELGNDVDDLTKSLRHKSNLLAKKLELRNNTKCDRYRTSQLYCIYWPDKGDDHIIAAYSTKELAAKVLGGDTFEHKLYATIFHYQIKLIDGDELSDHILAMVDENVDRRRLIIGS